MQNPAEAQDRIFRVPEARCRSSASCDDHDIETFHKMGLIEAHSLFHQTLDAMSDDRISHFLTYRDSETVDFHTVGKDIQHIAAVAPRSAFSVDLLEILVFLQSFGNSHSSPCRRKDHICCGLILSVSFFLLLFLLPGPCVRLLYSFS